MSSKLKLRYVFGGFLLGAIAGSVGAGHYINKNFDDHIVQSRCNFIQESVMNARAIDGENRYTRLDSLVNSALSQADILVSEEGVSEKSLRALQSLRDYCSEYKIETSDKLKEVFEGLEPTPPCKIEN